jgi:hypothetical protein
MGAYCSGEQCAGQDTIDIPRNYVVNMLLVLNHGRHCRLYAFVDYERNRRGYQKIAFATLNVIRKRVITKVMVDYSGSKL